MNGSRLRLSPALVISCIALLFALGGTGYAMTSPTVLRGGAAAAGTPKTVTVTATSVMDSASSHSAAAACPLKYHIVGGGFRYNLAGAPPAPIAIQYSGPLMANEWDVYGFEDSAYAGNWEVVAYAICSK